VGGASLGQNLAIIA